MELPSRLNNLAEDVKLTRYDFFGCILTSLSSEVVFFTQQCKTDDFAEQHYLVVDGGDSTHQQQVKLAACPMTSSFFCHHCREHHISGTIVSSPDIVSCTGCFLMCGHILHAMMSCTGVLPILH